MRINPIDTLRTSTNKGLMLDTNLLLLLLIGHADRRLIGGKRTEQFSTSDYDLLIEIVRRYRRPVTTPHILTEVSNLAGIAVTHKLKVRVFEDLHQWIQNTNEEQIEASAIGQSALVRYGIADGAMLAMCHREFLVLSVDFALVSAVQKLGGLAVNFNHLRDV